MKGSLVRLACNTEPGMNQNTDFAPAITLYSVPHDTPCHTESENEQVIQLDVIDLAEPDDDY